MPFHEILCFKNVEKLQSVRHPKIIFSIEMNHYFARRSMVGI